MAGNYKWSGSASREVDRSHLQFDESPEEVAEPVGRRILRRLFIAAFLIIVVMGTQKIVGRLVNKSSKPEVRIFLQESLSRTFSTMNKGELQRVATPRLDAELQQTRLESYLPQLKGLGTFKEFRGAEGEVTVAVPLIRNEGRYRATVELEHGLAELDVDLINQRKQWYIDAINVSSVRRTD